MGRLSMIMGVGAVLMAVQPQLRAEVQVDANPGSIILENRFLRAKIGEEGGKIISIYDKRTERDYAFSPAVTGGGGIGAGRIWEKPDWHELMTAKFELEVVSKTPEQAVVRARYRAAGGPAKGMDFENVYTLVEGECRLRQRFQIFSNENWAEFSPWLKNLIIQPSPLADKQTNAVFCQAKQGLYSELPVKPRQDQSLIFNLNEPWIGAVSESGKSGLCIVTDSRWLSHYYCWYGAEHFFTAEMIFKPFKFAPGGSWGVDIWYIPTKGIGHYHLATPEYVAGISPQGLELFAAVNIPSFSFAATTEKNDPSPGTPADIAAGECRISPCKVQEGTQDLRVLTTAAGKDTRHSVRANPGMAVSEFNSALFEMKTDVAPSDSAIATYLKDTLYLSPDMKVAIHFGMSANFKEPGRQVEFVLDIPDCIEVANPWPPQVQRDETTEREGVKYRTLRFKMNARTYYNVLDLYMSTTLRPGEKSKIFYRIAWDGGEQEARPLPVESVRIESCKKIPRRLVAGLGFYGIGILSRWPDIHNTLKRVGLNCVSLCDHDYDKIPQMREAVLKAKEQGMYTTANYSPTCHQMPADAPQEAKVQAIDGTVAEFICPSYRGPLMQEEIARATSYGEAGASIIYWDAESWRGRDFCFCPRCLERFKEYFKLHGKGLDEVCPKVFELNLEKYPEHHRLWGDFKLSLGTELFKLYRDEYARRLKASGITGTGPEELIVGNYDVTPGKIYHQFQRFDEQYAAGAINICMPSLYFGGDAKRVGIATRQTRDKLGCSRIIPWICGGDDTLRDSTGLEQKYVLLELFLNGSMGFTTWPYQGWDALDMRYLSQVMNMITPIESIIIDGSVMTGLKTSDSKVDAVGLTTGTEAAILVSGYYHASLPALTLNVESKSGAKLFDLATGEELASLSPGANSVSLTAYPEQARLLYLGQKAPETSFKCPPDKQTQTR